MRSSARRRSTTRRPLPTRSTPSAQPAAGSASSRPPSGAPSTAEIERRTHTHTHTLTHKPFACQCLARVYWLTTLRAFLGLNAGESPHFSSLRLRCSLFSSATIIQPCACPFSHLPHASASFQCFHQCFPCARAPPPVSSYYGIQPVHPSSLSVPFSFSMFQCFSSAFSSSSYSCCAKMSVFSTPVARSSSDLVELYSTRPEITRRARTKERLLLKGALYP